MTQSGIEPATFRFVAQYLNHCATAVPINTNSDIKYLIVPAIEGSCLYKTLFWELLRSESRNFAYLGVGYGLPLLFSINNVY